MKNFVVSFIFFAISIASCKHSSRSSPEVPREGRDEDSNLTPASMVKEIPQTYCNNNKERFGPASIAIVDNLAYVTNGDTKRGLSSCKVVGKKLIDCKTTAHGELAAQDGIVTQNDNIYISNMCHNSISVCKRNGSNLVECKRWKHPDFNSVSGMKISNGLLFLINHAGGKTNESIVVCTLNTNPIKCAATPEKFHSPYNIAFSSNGQNAFIIDNEAKIWSCDTDLKFPYLRNCKIAHSGIEPTEENCGSVSCFVNGYYSIAIDGDLAYITDFKRSKKPLTICKVDGSSLKDCQETTDEGDVLNESEGVIRSISIENSIAYFSENQTNSVTVCSISIKGLDNCVRSNMPKKEQNK